MSPDLKAAYFVGHPIYYMGPSEDRLIFDIFWTSRNIKIYHFFCATLIRRRVPLFQKCKTIIVVGIFVLSVTCRTCPPTPLTYYTNIVVWLFADPYPYCRVDRRLYNAVHKARIAGKPRLPQLTLYIRIQLSRLLAAKKYPWPAMYIIIIILSYALIYCVLNKHNIICIV